MESWLIPLDEFRAGHRSARPPSLYIVRSRHLGRPATMFGSLPIYLRRLRLHDPLAAMGPSSVPYVLDGSRFTELSFDSLFPCVRNVVATCSRLGKVL